MFRSRLSKPEAIATGILLGGVIGSLTAFLIAPKKGKDLRSDIQDELSAILISTKGISSKIVSNAKDLAEDILQNANKLLDLTRKYTDGNFNGTKESFQNEYSRIKNAINAAITVYRNYEESSKPVEEIVDDIFSEYENDDSPKFEGMGRRQS
jgi:gas vesicle protein